MTFTFDRKTDNVDDVMAADINELQAAIESLSQLSGGINLQGDHDASTEAYPASPYAGDLYIISVAGTISGTTYAVGDLIVYDGDEWIKIALSLNISGTLTYKGVWDASTEAYPEDPSIGDYYIINVAGTIEGTAYVVGDIITYDTDGNWAQTELGVEVVQDIDDLGDVDTTGVADGNALVYNSGTSTWIPEDRPKIYLSNIEIYTANDTWTKPAGLHHVIVEILAAGGGGGGVTAESAKTAVAGGGGPGGYSKKFIGADNLGSTETVTVGAKGNKGAAGNNNGSSGGTSSFGSHCSATGGSGGTGQASFSTVPRRGGSCGASGVGSGGDINAAGGIGAVGANLAVNATSGLVSGGGGNSIYGAGGAQRTSEGAGKNGSGYGSGGGGACSADSTTNLAGGDGTAGLVIVWEYTEAG